MTLRMALVSLLLSFSLLGCPPAPKEAPVIIVNNDITQLRYEPPLMPHQGVYYSKNPTSYSDWFNENGGSVTNKIGQILTEFYLRHKMDVPTSEGNSVIEQFNQVLPEEND